MSIKVNNNLSDLVELDIIENKDEVIINVNKKQKTLVPLEEVAVGAIVKIGEIECIALGKTVEGRFLITKNSVENMSFGFNCHYEESEVRKYCNNIFYRKLCQIVDKENIIPHRVFLNSEDGYEGNLLFIEDNISIMTTNYYRKFREYLPNPDKWWWTATPVTKFAYHYYVCIINNFGIIDKAETCFLLDVRPFFCLKSSLKVEVVDNN